MSLYFYNLTFTPDPPILGKLCCFWDYWGGYRDERILRYLDGNVSRGEMIALMGPSGAGKSTLLNCITQGKTYQGCNGQIKIRGLLANEVRASFINQHEEEHLLMSLTVSQALEYASLLKNAPKTPRKTHKTNVSTLITDLKLTGTENTIISKCSGGQKKRLAVAMELVGISKPHFLFLDEPTSGLDSYVGFQVVQLLAELATKHNIGIVTTIHQPSFKLFSLFTRAYIISASGEFVYNGHPKKLGNFLDVCGYPTNYRTTSENPVDTAVQLASTMDRRGRTTWFGIEDDVADEEVNTDIDLNIQNLEICSKMIRKSKQMGPYKHGPSTLELPGELELQDSGLCKGGAQFSLHNLFILILRCLHTSIWQQKKFILIRLAVHIATAGILAALYNRDIGQATGCVLLEPLNYQKNCTCGMSLEEMREESIASKNIKFHFFSILFLMFAALMPTVLTFPAEIKLFLNEYRNQWYSTFSYYISKTITEIPLQLIFPFFYTYFLYWFTNQPGMGHGDGTTLDFFTSRHAQFQLITILCSFIVQGLGFLIGIICVRSFNISIIVSSSTLLFLALFSGFYVKRVELGLHVLWITYLSFVRFGFESLIIILYGQDRCTTPEQSSILLAFGLNDNQLYPNVYVLIAQLITIRLLALVLLAYQANPNVLRFSRSRKEAYPNFVKHGHDDQRAPEMLTSENFEIEVRDTGNNQNQDEESIYGCIAKRVKRKSCNDEFRVSVRSQSAHEDEEGLEGLVTHILNDTQVSEAQRDQIETRTRDPNCDRNDWFLLKRDRLMADVAGNIFSMFDYTNGGKLAKKVLQDEISRGGNEDLTFEGNPCPDWISLIRSKYEEERATCILPCGLFVSVDNGIFASVPSGLVGTHGMVQIIISKTPPNQIAMLDFMDSWNPSLFVEYFEGNLHLTVRVDIDQRVH